VPKIIQIDMDRPRILFARVVRSALVLAGALHAAPQAAALDSLVLGRDEQWRGIAVMDGVQTANGRWGLYDLTLADAAYEPAPDTDLLLHFDAAPFSDAAGRYDIECLDPQISTREHVYGTGSAAFIGPQHALRLFARKGSLLSAGTMWQDFTLEFWLYPASLDNGDALLSWSNQRVEGESVVEQSLTVSVQKRRLAFRFENVFHGRGAPNVDVGGLTALVPRQWHHHLLRFDSRTGLLEYLVDGVPEAVAYATDTGREGGSISLPLIGAGSAEPLVIGEGMEACVDELRLSRRFVEEPVLTRLRGKTGVAVSRVYDLKLTGTSVDSIEAIYDTPPDTEVYFFYRMADRLKGRGELESSWVQFAPGATFPRGRGRYLQLMVELFPDGRLQRGPAVSSVTVRYEPDLPPAPPAKLVAHASNSTVRLAWSRVNETDVAGYRIYYGSRPGVYQQALDAGNVTEYEVAGLDNGALYYFVVATYDAADTGRRSAFSPEVSARPSGLN
jgi:hypothetical protein